jgi:hypothetical protein
MKVNVSEPVPVTTNCDPLPLPVEFTILMAFAALLSVAAHPKLVLLVNAAGAVSVIVFVPPISCELSCTICVLTCCVPAALYVAGTVVRFVTGVVLVIANGAVPVASRLLICEPNRGCDADVKFTYPSNWQGFDCVAQQ